MRFSWIARPAIIAWFVILFFLSLAVAIVTLSASQLQDRLASLSSSDVPVSVWQIERIRKEREIHAAQSLSLSQNLSAAALKQEQASTAIEELLGQAYEAEEELRRLTNDMITMVNLHEPLAFDSNSELDRLATQRKIEQIVGRLKREKILATASEVQLDKLYAEYRTALLRFDRVRPELAKHEQKKEAADKAVAEISKTLADADSKMDRLVGENAALRGANPAEIIDLIEEFSFIEGFAGGALYRFSVLPNELLVMVLVIAMGTLGATLQLTYDYYRLNAIPRPSHFLLRPMLGAITAIVLFIFLRAGVIVVTDSTKLNETPPLNPFFIAFVGIVAGFLSENAMQSVTTIGQSWLRGSDRATPVERWGIDLTKHVMAPKTLEEFAKATENDLKTVVQWFNTETTIPPEAQKQIGLWLGIDPHLLFTDLSPSP